MSCLVGGHCCNAADEKVWFEDIKSLFCSLSPIPSGSVTSAKRINSMTRLILYISLLIFI
jgi:hypothetical protein